MECGFRPHDRDRTTEMMEQRYVGFGPKWRGVGLQRERAFTVTRLTVGVSNEVQMVRNLTGGLPVVNQGRLASLGSIRKCLTPTQERKVEMTTGGERRPECKTDNRENA